MKKKKLKNKTPIVLAVVLNVLLLVAVLFLMRHVRNLLYSDVRINLIEVVTQNKNAVTSKLMLELSNLQMAADQLSERLRLAGGMERADLHEIFTAYCEDTENTEIYVATLDGDAFFGSGVNLSIAGRRYFKLAVEGNQNISERVVSRVTGEDIFAMSVPLRYDGRIVGTVQKAYDSQQMYDICTISMFSAQGASFIINSKGHVVVGMPNQSYEMELDDYFLTLHNQGNQEEATQMQADIAANRAGSVETVVDGVRYFSAYTPLEGIHDWFLISSVATSAVSPNANLVVKIFYGILISVVLISGLSLIYFQIYRGKQQDTLEDVAFHDPVTGGFTFTKFQMALRELLQQESETEYYLLAFDIDNFKYFNSFYGFDFGDCILRDITQELTARLLPGEFLARISSDHFVAVLRDVTADRMGELLDLMWTTEGVTAYLSAGVYAITDRTESINLMVDKASMAAQSAKGSLHKKVVQYTEKFDQQMVQNEQLKRQVEQALAQRDIIPFYQPKVDVNTGELVGAEALARWITREGKMISPAEFIPLCEKTGLITDLDMSIFEQVLLFLQEQMKAGIPCLPISVNFSRLHLTVEDFIHHITAKLREYDVPPHLIEIELTESVIFDNHEIIMDFADHLHDHGMHIAMDDFGSGYSSLNMLKDIPIDVLKIDRGFLESAQNPERQRIILSTIARMAAELQIGVVVEGVETEDNVAQMKEFGCVIAQGYFFARPMDKKSFETVFRAGRIE